MTNGKGLSSVDVSGGECTRYVAMACACDKVHVLMKVKWRGGDTSI